MAHTGMPGAVVPHGSADRGARGVAGSGGGSAGMTGARQAMSEGREGNKVIRAGE